jgi:hypothetical protein
VLGWGNWIFDSDCNEYWFRRNTVVHGGEFTHPNRIIQEAEVFLNENKIKNVKEWVIEKQSIDKGHKQWKDPPQGILQG